LLYDMERIAHSMNMSRNDWLRYNIAELVAKKKLAIMELLEKRYIEGKIGDEEFLQVAGFKPKAELRRLRDRQLDAMEKASVAARKALLDVAEKVK